MFVCAWRARVCLYPVQALDPFHVDLDRYRHMHRDNPG